VLHDVLFDLVRDHGTAMVVVTHNAALASRTDRILRLASGVLELAEPDEHLQDAGD